MKTYPSWRRSLALLSCLILLNACSDTEDPTDNQEEVNLSCGAGTTLVDGACVIADFGCPEGEVYTPAGQCLAPDVFCGSDTVYDAGSDGCVSATEVSCGEGTVEQDGRCVVEDAKSCGSGTVLADGVCVLSSSVCGPGTQLAEEACLPSAGACSSGTDFDVLLGECVDLNSVECGDDTVLGDNNACVPLVTYADELASQADLDASDTGTTITLGDIGEQTIFTGTMSNQNNLFQVFKIDGEAGKWIQVTLYPRGVPSLGFRLRESFGSWQRRVLPGYYSVPSRTFAMPANGEYDLIIENSLSTAVGGPFGDPSWSYVGVIEVIEAPAAQTWDFQNEPLTGNLATLESNLFEVGLPTDAQTLFLTDYIGPNANLPRVEVWTSPTEYLDSFELNTNDLITVDPDELSGTVYLLFDAREFNGPTTAFEVSAQPTTTLLPGAFADASFQAEAGDILWIRHRNANASDMSAQVVFNGQVVYEADGLRADNRSSYSLDDIKGGFFYVPEDGLYTVEHLNEGSSSIEGFFSNSQVVSVPAFVAGEEPESFDTFIAAEGLSRGDWRFATLTTTTASEISGSSTVGSGRSDVSIFNLDYERVENFTTSGTTQEFDFTLPNPGTYIIAIRARDSISGGIQLNVDTTPLESLPVGDSVTETFTAAPFDVFRFQGDFTEGGTPSLTLTNPDDVTVLDIATIEAGNEIFYLIPGAGQYTLDLANNSDEATIGLDYEFEVLTPDPVLSYSGSFDDVIATTATLAEGDHEYLILRSLTGLNFEMTATFGQDEEGQIRIINLTDDQTLEASGTDEATLANPTFTAGTYLIEVEALTELATGYSLEIVGEEINVISVTRTYDEAVTIPIDDDYFSTVQVAGCSEVISAEILIEWDEFWNNWVNVYITPPNGDELHLWENNSFGSDDEMYFPVDDDPADDLDLLSGQDANGTWTLRSQGRSSTYEAFLRSWTLTLICTVE